MPLIRLLSPQEHIPLVLPLKAPAIGGDRGQIEGSREGSRVLIISLFLTWVVVIRVCAMYKHLFIKPQMLDGAAALENSLSFPPKT